MTPLPKTARKKQDRPGIYNQFYLEWSIWHDMINRCYNENYHSWNHYGGRRIRVCQKWRGVKKKKIRRGGFAAFLADMGPRPSPNHTLDRINTNKGYYPKNCRWATWKEQGRNRRNNVMITHNGETRPVVDWSEILKIPSKVIYSRIKNGWSHEEALTKPVIKITPQTYTYNGVTKTAYKWAKEMGLGDNTVTTRVLAGWSLKEAIFTPSQIRKNPHAM